MNLSAYLAESIRNIMAKAYLNVLGNPREARALGGEHTGGCTLYEHRDEVKAMME